jgi:asparagine synthase (glutamine-hydrolysing)
MTDPVDGQHTLVFNGEIYNYIDLRERLRSKGHEFRSSGDTEVMLRSLVLSGERAVGDLRGMFAFALWDASRHQIVLARDPLGIKPLYICRNPDPDRVGDWSLMFASEIRTILASQLLTRPRLNPGAVANYIWNGFVVGPDTIVDDIESLPPGYVLNFDLSGAERSRIAYWSYPQSTSSEKHGAADVREALRESVKIHLASDVPVGVFLSGGVDSSAVANMAAKSSQTEIVTFTLAFNESEFNEAPFSREIAKAIGTRHLEVKLTEDQFLSSLDDALLAMDQPSFDGLNSFFISKAVREAGIKVALLGSGGDELFGGYKSFRELPRFQDLARKVSWLPPCVRNGFAKLVSGMMERSSDGVGSQARWAKFPNMMKSSDSILQLYQLAYALFLPEFQNRLLGAGLDQGRRASGLPDMMSRDLSEQIEGRSSLSAIGILEQRLFLGERLLRDADSTSMAVSLESRLPLVDSVVTDVVSRLPESVRYAQLGRKQLLRDVGLEGLDPQLFERPKQGFLMPFDRWIRQRLGTEMTHIMSDEHLCKAVGLNAATVRLLWGAFQSGTSVYWSRIWAIYVLLRWCDRNDIRLQATS